MTAHCQQAKSDQATRCTFRLEGVRAASIALVGSFNQWSTTRHLMRLVDGRWETEVTLPPGRHSYGFFAIEKDAIPRGTVLQLRSTIEIGSPEAQFANSNCLTTACLAD